MYLPQVSYRSACEVNAFGYFVGISVKGSQGCPITFVAMQCTICLSPESGSDSDPGTYWDPDAWRFIRNSGASCLLIGRNLFCLCIEYFRFVEWKSGSKTFYGVKVPC